ncbi:MAG: hypothetical protein M0Z89_07865, partial [Nitrospiraceae bacterium]|nr:hypothetical protein [Nitrospiraceae bacterium]
MRKRAASIRLLTSSICLIMLILSSSAFAQSDEEKSFLSMYFSKDELNVISTTRSLKSISQVAENVTVVTAAEIKLMNAHTLADVLNTVTGIQVF